MNTIDYQPLWSYPFVFRRIKRVDHEFGYLYQNNEYMPLKRNSGACAILFPWLKIGKLEPNYDPIAPMMYFEPYLFSDIDELSQFFARLVDVTVDKLDYWQNGLKNIANCGVTVDECVEFIGKLTPPTKAQAPREGIMGTLEYEERKRKQKLLDDIEAKIQTIYYSSGINNSCESYREFK